MAETAARERAVGGVAVILACGLLRTPYAKTAHGLIRGPSRYRVAAVVDRDCAGADAGQILDGRSRGIPVVASLRDALDLGPPAPDHCVVGVATAGGRWPAPLHGELRAAAAAGLTLVNGLHQQLADDPELVRLAAAAGGRLLDLRRPRPAQELRYWTGEALSLTCPRVAVLGTDCAVGKRTTCTLLREALRARGWKAEMIYTGQTGWLQGIAHGFILDATLNDFVPGELEGAVLACARDTAPDVILIEGQSSLRNPSGPCGAEILLSAGARGVILQHAPARRVFEGLETLGLSIPSLKEEMALIRLLGARVWAVTLSHEGLTPEQAEAARLRLGKDLGVPVATPLLEGLERVADAVEARLEAGPP